MNYGFPQEEFHFLGLMDVSDTPCIQAPKYILIARWALCFAIGQQTAGNGGVRLLRCLQAKKRIQENCGQIIKIITRESKNHVT